MKDLLEVFYHRRRPSREEKAEIQMYSKPPSYSYLFMKLWPRKINGWKTLNVLLESLWIPWKIAGIGPVS
jgi:hypothetical protein